MSPSAHDYEHDDGPFPLVGYLVINLAAWAFLAVALAFTGWAIGDWRGLGVFFLILAVAFTGVSAFDFIYDRVASVGRKGAKGRGKPRVSPRRS